MNPPRLDRLSALVDGLAPVVTLTTDRTDFTTASEGATPDHGLVIFLLSAGALRLHRPGAVTDLQAPAWWHCRPRCPTNWNAWTARRRCA
jgi:hypothetical protein